MRTRIPEGNLIDGYSQENVKHCAYELAVGSAALVTDDGKPTEKKLDLDGEPVAIPPGQFAVVLTEEVVAVPTNAIAFISVRASVKFKGLINVSGFHVDPGYRDRLKFSLYNAGGRTIHLKRGDRIFMIWYADLDKETTDGYRGSPTKNRNLTSDDHNRMEGEVASPGQLRKETEALKTELKKEIQDIKNEFAAWKTAFAVLTTITLGIFVLLLRQCAFPSDPSSSASTIPSNAIKATAPTNTPPTNSQQTTP